MTIFTFFEVKTLINDAIPKNADKDIVRTALLSLITPRLELTIECLSKSIQDLIPENIAAESIINVIVDALVTQSLARTGSDYLIQNLRHIQQLIYVEYMKTLLFAIADVDGFKSTHLAELNRLAFSDEESAFIDQNSKNIITALMNGTQISELLSKN
jgi:hypothetical protein